MQFDFRPSAHVVQQIAAIERFAGKWESFSKKPTSICQQSSICEQHLRNALFEGAIAAFSLDSTCPLAIQLFIRSHLAKPSGRNDYFTGHLTEHFTPSSDSLESLYTEKKDFFIASAHPSLHAYLEAHKCSDFDFTLESIDKLLLAIAINEHTSFQKNASIKNNNGHDNSSKFLYRANHEYFVMPIADGTNYEIVFPTMSAFLVEPRLRILVNWVNGELAKKVYHPLILISLFHLLFLQIQPYVTANHRLSFLIVWYLLNKEGYDFVRFAHFSTCLFKKKANYFAALKQAEKTANNNWSTLNIWVELFLDCLFEATQVVNDTVIAPVQVRDFLTETQQRILNFARVYGPVTREKVAVETGISVSTVKYNLGILSARGHLIRQGGGRGTTYRAASFVPIEITHN